MFAKNLESLLTELSQKGDMSHVPYEDGPERFESLRAYRQLPPGRENRSKPLTDAEIAAAVLGLVSPNPKWAGHSALILGDLRPVGGPEGSFWGAPRLQDAIALMIADETARHSLVRLQVSGAERFTNSSGSSTLTFEVDRQRRKTYFVSKMAISLSAPGAERDFDVDRLHAPMSRELSFNRAFFDELAEAVSLARTLKTPLRGDGSEYDTEEARQARYRKLGAGPGSHFLNIGVDNQVTWPREETVVKFDQYTLVLMPKTNDHVQSIHIDLTANRLSDAAAKTIINRYLSIMTWCDDQHAIAQDGWSGNPVPVAVPRRNLAFTTTSQWFFSHKIPDSQQACRALALYREARNAEQNFMVSYAVLNFFKIIELKYDERNGVKNWFRDNFEIVTTSFGFSEAFERFARFCGNEKPHQYIYKACRLAVAHANKDSKSDPDEAEELQRLHVAADVLRAFARHFIKVEFKVSDSVYSGD
jgi:hypothetical protein